MTKIIFCLLFAFIVSSLAKTADEWRGRAIYQIITDRFAKTNADRSPCGNFANYCGGTFKGIHNNLDYIQKMGFDAIWISPVIQNNPGGYHGYWALNIFEINEKFGTAAELKALIKACHARDIWVMVDVVANHMGPKQRSDYSDKYPFNSPDHYHNDVDCSQIDPNNQVALETCWLAQLPDLNQDNDFVRSQLLTWITELVTTYDIDGLRIDTVPYVSKSFWRDFTQAAGVYTVGEVFNGYLPYDAGYEGPIDGILNYPFFFTIGSVFRQYNSMNNIQSYYSGASTWPDLGLLGNFVDNHDNSRFLYGSGDHTAFRAALAFCLTTVGIPIVYYGSEQYYGGGPDPNNREPLWTNINIHTDAIDFLATINKFRKSSKFYKETQIQRYSDDRFYAFTRGDHFFAFTNTQDTQQRTITYHPYSDGTVLCNIFYPSVDCITVQNKQFTVNLNNGEVKIYTPKNSQASEHNVTKVKIQIETEDGNVIETTISGHLKIEDAEKQIKLIEEVYRGIEI